MKQALKLTSVLHRKINAKSLFLTFGNVSIGLHWCNSEKHQLAAALKLQIVEKNTDHPIATEKIHLNFPLVAGWCKSISSTSSNVS